MLVSIKLWSLFGSILTPALSHAQTEVKVNTNAMDAILSANIVVQITLVILVGMSVVSWMIIFTKRSQFKKVENANPAFTDQFWQAASLEQVNERIDQYRSSNLAEVFRAGYSELQKMADSSLSKTSTEKPMLTGIDNLERSLRKAIDSQISFYEQRLSILATTGSTGPFIGLFGTVWGIMGSFQKIAQTNSANLAVVAPGISEALIATGIGLAAAIPATVAYNHYITKLKKHELEMNNFAADFLNIAKRNFFKED